MKRSHIRKKAFLSVLAAFLTIALLAGCGGGGGSSSGGGGEQTSGSDAEFEQAVNLYNSNNCVSCHAADLSGNMGGNTNLKKVGSRLSKDEIAQVISEGRGVMPSFADSLSQEEIDQLAEWLSTKK